MTTQELYELTRGHEGKPYWHRWVGFGERKNGEPYLTIHRTAFDDADAAEALLIGSAVKWLVDRQGFFESDLVDGKYAVSFMDKADDQDFAWADSLLAALLAACKAVEEVR